MVKLIWCLWLCDHSCLIKVDPPHGVQLNVMRNPHRPNDYFKNDMDQNCYDLLTFILPSHLMCYGHLNRPVTNVIYVACCCRLYVP